MCRVTGFLLPRPAALRQPFLEGERSLRNLAGRVEDYESLPHLLQEFRRQKKLGLATEVPSNWNPHGWAVRGATPSGEIKEARSVGTAFDDKSFEQAIDDLDRELNSGVAHIRHATNGPVALKNTHAMPFGPDERFSWAHNGTIQYFDRHRPRFLAELERVAPDRVAAARTANDSRTAMYLFEGNLRAVAKDLGNPTADELVLAMDRTVSTVSRLIDVPRGKLLALQELLERLIARLTGKPQPLPRLTGLNFVASTPDALVATRANRTLFMNESFGVNARAAPLHDGSKIDGLVVSSEPYTDGLGWQAVPDMSIVATDRASGQLKLQPMSDPIPVLDKVKHPTSGA
jgi:predicted glutamine amidotransferase